MPVATEPVRTVCLAHELRIRASAQREDDGAVTVRVTKVAVGPISEQEAAGTAEFGDIRGYAPAIEALAAG